MNRRLGKNLLPVLIACLLFTITACSKKKPEALRTPDLPSWNVYIAGSVYNGTKDIAVLWKNGVAVSLTNGATNAYATGVFALANDVYVVGNEYNGTRQIARLWKNGVSSGSL